MTFFASDVHLGLDLKDPKDREARFVAFLESIPKDKTESLYLLDAGVKVYFFQGNHDIWCYHYFQDMGIRILQQPYVVNIGGKIFCLGHGDGLGPGHFWYKLMRWGFREKFFQSLFSLLHPYLAFRFGKGWSKKSRVAKTVEYKFKGKEEPLYKFAEDFSAKRHIDYFVFGHFHCDVRMKLPGGSGLLVLRTLKKHHLINLQLMMKMLLKQLSIKIRLMQI